jgi:integrase
MKAKVTKRTVNALLPGESAADTEIKGFVARRLTSGTVTYGFRYRNRAGQQRWLPLGLHGQVTADEARDLAKKRAGEVADDRDPMAERITRRAAATNTVDGVLDKFLVRYVRKRPLKSAGEIERAFNVYVRPRLGKRSIYDLGRRDIVEMLDAIEDENGPVMCDRVLAYLRKAFNWQASRDEQFNSPIVGGMQRTKPKERARQRILDDQEIRDLWAALDDLKTETPAPFPSLVKTLLLTAQRRDEVANMNWLEIEDNCWTLPAGRSKNGQANEVPLTDSVRALLGEPQRTAYVFTTTGGRRPFSGFSKAKAALDKKMGELQRADKRKPREHWVLHDLRRTARSLMARAGVPTDHAERVLGHTIGGVRGVYDRFAYREEKLDALERLAELVERILHSSDPAIRSNRSTAEVRHVHPDSQGSLT